MYNKTSINWLLLIFGDSSISVVTMRRLFSNILFPLFVSAVTLTLVTVKAGELTFELPDNEKQCFHELIDKGVKSTLEFQVL